MKKRLLIIVSAGILGLSTQAFAHNYHDLNFSICTGSQVKPLVDTLVDNNHAPADITKVDDSSFKIDGYWLSGFYNTNDTVVYKLMDANNNVQGRCSLKIYQPWGSRMSINLTEPCTGNLAFTNFQFPDGDSEGCLNFYQPLAKPA